MSEETKDENEEERAAKEKLAALEEDPPDKLEDWPDDEAKYLTFGGPEGDHSYDEGPEKNLGPSSLRRHEDGSIEVEGEKVDDPDEFKGEPIPGGPTDPDAPDASGEESSGEESSGVGRQSSEDEDED